MNRKQIDVIEQNVTIQEVLALHGIRTSRKRCRCPFHASRPDTFSFTDEVYHCFSCGESGGPIQLEAKLSGVTNDEAIKILADRFGLDVTNRPMTKEEKRNWYLNKELEESFDKYQDDLNEYYRFMSALYRGISKVLMQMPDDPYFTEMKESLNTWLDDNIDGVKQPWIFQPSAWTISLIQQNASLINS